MESVNKSIYMFTITCAAGLGFEVRSLRSGQRETILAFTLLNIFRSCEAIIY